MLEKRVTGTGQEVAWRTNRNGMTEGLVEIFMVLPSQVGEL